MPNPLNEIGIEIKGYVMRGSRNFSIIVLDLMILIPHFKTLHLRKDIVIRSQRDYFRKRTSHFFSQQKIVHPNELLNESFCNFF